MEIKEITIPFHYSIRSIFCAKVRNYRKRSIWIYMICSLIMAYGLNLYFDDNVNKIFYKFIFIFVSLILFSFILIIISSHVIYFKKDQYGMEITFRNSKIEVFWVYKGIKEEKSWDWIKCFEEVNGIYYFDLDIYPRNVMMLRKQSLTLEENNTLHNWLQENRKVR